MSPWEQSQDRHMLCSPRFATCGRICLGPTLGMQATPKLFQLRGPPQVMILLANLPLPKRYRQGMLPLALPRTRFCRAWLMISLQGALLCLPGSWIQMKLQKLMMKDWKKMLVLSTSGTSQERHGHRVDCSSSSKTRFLILVLTVAGLLCNRPRVANILGGQLCL